MCPRSQHLWAVRLAQLTRLIRPGILPATFAAMAEAVSAVAETLREPSVTCLFLWFWLMATLLPRFPFPCQALVPRNSRSLSIARRLFWQKQTRDEVMTELASHYLIMAGTQMPVTAQKPINRPYSDAGSHRITQKLYPN